MAVVTMNMDATFSMTAAASVQITKNFDTAESDLHMWPVISVQTADAPTLDGHGSVPQMWFRCTPTLSSTGEFVDGQRPSPAEIKNYADVQWVPTSETWNVTTGTWLPFRSGLNDYSWNADLLTQPIQGNITYRMGRELITVPRMRLTGGQHLTSNFQGGTADASEWTISMVVMLESSDGRYPLLDWGIPGYVAQTPPVTRTSIFVSEVIEFGWRAANGIVDPVVPITKYRPAFLTLTVTPPTVTMTMSMGAGFSFKAVATDDLGPSATELQFFIGRSTDSGTEDGDFSILEVSLWGRALSESEVILLNSRYASVYGASSEWQS